MAQVLRVISLAVAALSLPAAETGVIEGKVINSITHEGVGAVSIGLEGDGKSLRFRLETSSSGDFRLELSPGVHSLSFEKDGFDTPEYEEPTVKISVPAGGTVHLIQEMDPLTTISGKVLDSDNHGLKRSTVEVLSGRGRLYKTVATDGVGAFEIRNLHPGAYLLRSTPDRPAARDTRDFSVNPSAPARERRTLVAPAYYPGVRSLPEASVIRVNGEKRLDGYDIRLPRLPVFAIRGTVVEPGGDPLPKAIVSLRSADMHYMTEDAPGDAQLTTSEDGRFDFDSVTPGKWYLDASGSGSKYLLRSFVTAEVVNRAVELSIRLAPPFSLDVSVEGPPTDPTGRRGPTFNLVPADGPIDQQVYSGGPRGGKFTVDRVYSGRYGFAASNVTGYYLDSILLGGRDILGREVELMDGTPAIRLLYKRDGGSLRGKLENDASATVVVVPEETSPDYWQPIKTDDHGRFEIGGLRPGNYFVLAVQRREALQDPGFLKIIEQQARRIIVTAGNTTTVDPPLIAWPR